jgi:hypothetical protein
MIIKDISNDYQPIDGDFPVRFFGLQVHGVPHVHEHPTGRQGMSKNVRPFVCCFKMVYIY